MVSPTVYIVMFTLSALWCGLLAINYRDKPFVCAGLTIVSLFWVLMDIMVLI